MKVTAILVLRAVPEGKKVDPAVLSNALDVNQFAFFQRGTAKEFILFVARTIYCEPYSHGRPQSVEQDEYIVHFYNRNGLCVLTFVDREYPLRSVFSVISTVLDEYTQQFGNSWQRQTTDKIEAWPYHTEALQRGLHKTIDSVLARGEKLDTLVDKSTDLSAASQLLDKHAKKTNQCCSIL